MGITFTVFSFTGLQNLTMGNGTSVSHNVPTKALEEQMKKMADDIEEQKQNENDLEKLRNRHVKHLHQREPEVSNVTHDKTTFVNEIDMWLSGRIVRDPIELHVLESGLPVRAGMWKYHIKDTGTSMTDAYYKIMHDRFTDTIDVHKMKEYFRTIRDNHKLACDKATPDKLTITTGLPEYQGTWVLNKSLYSGYKNVKSGEFKNVQEMLAQSKGQDELVKGGLPSANPGPPSSKPKIDSLKSSWEPELPGMDEMCAPPAFPPPGAGRVWKANGITVKPRTRRLAVASPHRAQGDEIGFHYAGTMIGGFSVVTLVGAYLYRRFLRSSKPEDHREL